MGLEPWNRCSSAENLYGSTMCSSQTQRPPVGLELEEGVDQVGAEAANLTLSGRRQLSYGWAEGSHLGPQQTWLSS